MAKVKKPLLQPAKKAIKKTSEVQLQNELVGNTKCTGARRLYNNFIRKLRFHLEYAGDYSPSRKFPAAGLKDEALAKYVLALAVSFSPSSR